MLQVGMYVRCPYDDETLNYAEAKSFLFGQITKITSESNLDIVSVVFHDPLNLRAFFSTLPAKHDYPANVISRAQAFDNITVRYQNKKATLLCSAQTALVKTGFRSYYIEQGSDASKAVYCINESDIEIPFTKANYNPAAQLERYELQNPMWYAQRRIVSKFTNTLSNSPAGFENILGTRVHLFEHQVDTIIRALSEQPCRLMLADEVGLGKTIEALSIVKGFTDKNPTFKTLIIVPETLLYQWDTELSYKFWQDAQIWGQQSHANVSNLLISTTAFVRDFKTITTLYKWDMCIVDETHNLLSNSLLYNAVLSISKQTKNLLLLSATPIINRAEEYGKLLTLLNPTRFEHMPKEDFSRLLDLQKSIQDIVFQLMRDLPDYIEYDLFDDFINDLTEINDIITDPKLTELIESIDHSAEDLGLYQVKLCLSYISEFYQIERGIIRHRRAEIAAADIKRELIALPYTMGDATLGFHEENCYNAVLNLCEELLNDNLSLDLICELLLACLSSPYALQFALEQNKPILNSYSTSALETVLQYWTSDYNQEIDRIDSVVDDIESFHSKFAKIVDYIDQEDYEEEKKFLIFTGFTHTALNLERCLQTFFGEDTTACFHHGQTPEQMQDAATLFQTSSTCRFMICDESGGEGRNFQIADFIIHCDLPFSPALLEQRIGRLDRIGRDTSKSVTSIVIYAEETLEQNLFDIYNTGLNIFNQSLCGMEIAFGEIRATIDANLSRNIHYGLSDAVIPIKNYAGQISDAVERERYYDLARQLDTNLQTKLTNLICKFTQNDGQELMDTLLAWPSMAGVNNIRMGHPFHDNTTVLTLDSDVTSYSFRSMMHTLYFPPPMEELAKRSKYNGDIRGTFSRTAAVKYESLTFFAPFNPFFDSIVTNAQECYKGRCTAVEIPDAPFKWIGLVLTWNIKYDPRALFEKGYSSDFVSLITRYLPLEQVVHTYPITSSSDDIPSFDVIDVMDGYNLRQCKHLGKRGNSSLARFKQRFPQAPWSKKIRDVYKESKSQVLSDYLASLTQNIDAKKNLEQHITAHEARKLFYGVDSQDLLTTQEQIDTLLIGLEHPTIELDSIAFVDFRP